MQRCDDSQAAQHIEGSGAFKDIFGPVEPQLVALRCEARLLARSNLPAAVQLLQEGQDAALREQHQRLYQSLAMEEAALQLTAGDLSAAEAVARRTRLLDESPTRAGRDALKLIEARFRLARGELGGGVTSGPPCGRNSA